MHRARQEVRRRQAVPVLSEEVTVLPREAQVGAVVLPLRHDLLDAHWTRRPPKPFSRSQDRVCKAPSEAPVLRLNQSPSSSLPSAMIERGGLARFNPNTASS